MNCNNGHAYTRVKTIPWGKITEHNELSIQYQTAVYECENCNAKKWVREEKTTLSQFE